jgi:hypothetical protein
MLDHGKVGIEFALETNLGLALGCHVYHRPDHVFDYGSQRSLGYWRVGGCKANLSKADAANITNIVSSNTLHSNVLYSFVCLGNVLVMSCPITPFEPPRIKQWYIYMTPSLGPNIHPQMVPSETISSQGNKEIAPSLLEWHQEGLVVEWVVMSIGLISNWENESLPAFTTNNVVSPPTDT